MLYNMPVPDGINADTKVSTLFREYPETIDYLLSLGLCECKDTIVMALKEVAKEKGMDLDKLLREVKSRVR
ncbi:hypothetical protein MNBD_NITROSPIRAE03-473 [hydrothermal vent metagenome]|uniref:DUF1858 domain-containing protein n=1 Tax=hydrothermal vent metagenome TaxID=652676 RepID=A0A3B1CYA3_9ZZZZ|nr:MAG: hypothetical protein IEMM0007_1864 [bacterium]